MATAISSALASPDAVLRIADNSDAFQTLEITGGNFRANINSSDVTALGDQVDTMRPVTITATLDIEFVSESNTFAFIREWATPGNFRQERLFEIGENGTANGRPRISGQVCLSSADIGFTAKQTDSISLSLHVQTFAVGTFS